MKRFDNYPRIMIAAPNGESGKTLVSVALSAIYTKNKYSVRGFKKGPDYIDPLWLSAATGRAAINLDPWFFEDQIVSQFRRYAYGADLSIIEANHGFYDSVDEAGRYSNAELAKKLNVPVLLVVNVQKMGRSVAALINGFRQFDSSVNICGVILNKVGGERHRKKLTSAVREYCQIPVLGCIPRRESPVEQKYLGLAPPVPGALQEAEAVIIQKMVAMTENDVDWRQILEIAQKAEMLPLTDFLQAPEETGETFSEKKTECRIAYALDEAFHFYYRENLESLQRLGARLIAFSPLHDTELPETDAIYLGGGFPERCAAQLSENRRMAKQIADNAEKGMPIYAECGGMMYLARDLTWDSQRYAMTGALDAGVQMTKKPIGRGYAKFIIPEAPNRDTLWKFRANTETRAHEFHYSRLEDFSNPESLVYRLERGEGIAQGKDGWLYKNILASYVHLHTLAAPWWAEAFVNAAFGYARQKEGFSS